MSKPKRVLSICAKTSDMFSSVYREDGVVKGNYDGYVPNFFPNEHWGDYIELDIDVDTGQILNWNKPTVKDIKLLCPKD